MQDPKSVFEHVSKRAEGATLDFKRELYKLGSIKGVADLVQDVICMANTPRDGSAYIACGFTYSPETGPVPVGMPEQVDGIKLRDQLNAASVQPLPQINYFPLTVGDKQFGIIEIPVQRAVGRPFFPLREFGGMKQGELWLRRESGNCRADADDTMRIAEWFLNGKVSPMPVGTEGQWTRFREAVGTFESGRVHVLIADQLPKASREVHASLGLAPWIAAFDFDPLSEQEGLLFAVRPEIERGRNLQLVVKDDTSPTFGRSATAWVFAKGLVGRGAQSGQQRFNGWLKEFGRDLRTRVEALAVAVTPSPVTVVALWHDPSTSEFLSKAIEELIQSFGESLTVVVVSAAIDRLQDVLNKHDAIGVGLDAGALSLGIRNLYAEQLTTSERCLLPTRDEGIPRDLDTRDRLWIEEDLELVHLNAGLVGDRQPSQFAKGETIAWRDLQLGYDCQRELTDKLRKRIEQELRDGKTVRVNLYHRPGAGGSTVARRVAWDVHTRFPTAVLHRADAGRTADRLTKLYALTQLPVLLVIDGSELSDTSVDQVYDAVRSQQTPVVMLQVLRRFNPTAEPARDFLLPTELSSVEADRFYEAYGRLVPSRLDALKARAKAKAGGDRTAFFFGLEAFGRDFVGLTKFVESRLAGTTDVAKRVIGFLALAYRYAQQPLPAASFADVLGYPRARKVALDKALPAPSLELLVTEPQEGWRMSHALIGDEVLMQLLCPAAQDRANLWKQALSEWVREFIVFLRGTSPVPSEQLLEVASRSVILRDNRELLGTEQSGQKKLSQLLEDIPSVQGRLEVLRCMTQVFPDEPHFHAHLGRYCGLLGRFEEALAAVDRALQINPRDSLLHHMRGMTLRHRANEFFDQNADLKTVVPTVREACKSFAEARRWNPENEYGFISEVQLLIRLLDHAGKQAKRPVSEMIGQSATDPFVREAIDRAEELLEQISTQREGENLSQYAEECRAQLDLLYGDHSTALQTWDNLLTRSDVAKPAIRRQVVRAHVRRHQGAWSALKPKELRRCIELLEANLAENPNDPASVVLWLRAIRQDPNFNLLDSALERVIHWKQNTNSVDAAFYLYVLHALAALEGSALATRDFEMALQECQSLARARRNRNHSIEWLGPGKGVHRLVHRSQLGEWAETFWKNAEVLERVSGRIASIDAPQRGWIELPGGLKAFFVPAKGDFHGGRDENQSVEFYLGFSYDGPRAWEVRPVKAR